MSATCATITSRTGKCSEVTYICPQAEFMSYARVHREVGISPSPSHHVKGRKGQSIMLSNATLFQCCVKCLGIPHLPLLIAMGVGLEVWFWTSKLSGVSQDKAGTVDWPGTGRCSSSQLVWMAGWWLAENTAKYFLLFSPLRDTPAEKQVWSAATPVLHETNTSNHSQTHARHQSGRLLTIAFFGPSLGVY